MEEDGDNASYTVDEKELVGNAAEQKNWRGIIIALVVILVVLSLIVLAIVIATPRTVTKNYGEPFTFDDFNSGLYKPRGVDIRWIKDSSKFLYKTKDGELRVVSCDVNCTHYVIMKNDTFIHHEIHDYKLSPDGNYLLLKTNVKKIFRHSSHAEYSIFNISSGNEPVPVLGPDLANKKPGANDYQYVGWTPTGTGLVLVHQNNIYYKKTADATPEQWTTSGKEGVVYNGVPDWVFEEEVLGSDHALWWSPTGRHMMYASFNDTNVQNFTFTWYGDLRDQYTKQYTVAYPKAGMTNPTFTLYIKTLPKGQPQALVAPAELGPDHLFTTVSWVSDSQVLVTWTNRVQTKAVITKCTLAGGKWTCSESQKIEPKDGWIDIFTPQLVSKDGSKYFMIQPKTEGSSGQYKHIAMVTVKADANATDKRTFLTNGHYEVTSLVSYNDDKELLYYLSPGKNPADMHLYSLDVTSTEIVCLTCGDEDCLYNRASVADTGEFYLLSCLGPGVPRHSLMAPNDTMGRLVQLMENNTDVAERLSKKALPWVKYEQIEIETGEKMWAKMYMPPILNVEKSLTYPLLLDVYGGPGSQKVTNEFKIDWSTYLTSTKHFIVAHVDPRGSSGRGDKWRHAMFRKLGQHEVTDTVAAGKFFKTLHYVKEDALSIWGWSYGGYLTAMVLGQKEKDFKCGISVAPVTDWQYYDSIYTERYMGKPQDNIDSYKDANVSKYAENFHGKSYFLIHGTGDDNVHFQNTAQFTKALTEAGIYYRFMMYSDKAHGLEGARYREHLHVSMEDFLFECYEGWSPLFGKEPPEVDD